MALRRAPHRAESLYWRGAVLGDLGRHREALRSIEAALRVLPNSDHWLLEDLFYEKVTILDALGLHDAAVAACEAGLDRCPGSPLLRAALAPAERARVRSSLKVLRGGAG
jgi:tetratricopeptide (TPR) repeat protein